MPPRSADGGGVAADAPDHVAAWVAAMRRGDFTRAWAISDTLNAARDPAGRDDPTVPYHRRWVWDGRAVDGQDVLVRCYHGLGDTLQYLRYLPVLARRAASVTIEVQPHLVPLLAVFEGIARIVPFDVARALPASPCDVEIGELPLALRTPPDALPCPYLDAPPAPLPAGTIGLCHLCGDWDVARSIPEEALFPIVAGRRCVTLAAAPSTLPVLNPQGCPLDIHATASLVAGAALVITVDTMIAHLAGALGRPTWLLLKHEPDWRWPTEGDTTPWYPSMRLYHQPAPGDWAGVIAQVAGDLVDRSPRG